jgi:hypothetical protein
VRQSFVYGSVYLRVMRRMSAWSLANTLRAMRQLRVHGTWRQLGWAGARSHLWFWKNLTVVAAWCNCVLLVVAARAGAAVMAMSVAVRIARLRSRLLAGGHELGGPSDGPPGDEGQNDGKGCGCHPGNRCPWTNSPASVSMSRV